MRGDLPPNHPAWALEAKYLALGIVNIITVLSPQRIIMGGGVMDQAHLFPQIRSEVVRLLNGYIQRPQIQEDIDQYIVPPGLGNRAGVRRCLCAGAGRPARRHSVSSTAVTIRRRLYSYRTSAPAPQRAQRRLGAGVSTSHQAAVAGTGRKDAARQPPQL